MREIKFRGLTANDTWVYGDLTHDRPDDTVYYKEYPCRIHWYEGTTHCNMPIKKGTEGLFTGLLDKNEKEIYEGDILAPMANDFLPEYKGVWQVVYRDGAYFGETDDGREETWIPYWTPDKEIEVIGNIYENGDLLK